MKNAVNWFEIPVNDMDRAVKFYQGMLSTDLHKEVFGGIPHAIFPTDKAKDSVSGSLVKDDKRKPNPEGTLLYLNVEGKLDACLQRTPGVGGSVVLPRTGIGEHGFIAIVRDTEGNKLCVVCHAAPGGLKG